MNLLDANDLRALAQVLDQMQINEQETGVQATGQLTSPSGIGVDLVRVINDGALEKYTVDIS